MNFEMWESCNIGHWADHKRPNNIEKLCYDSRKIEQGDCFIALKTEKNDGNLFLVDALTHGATCAIVTQANFIANIPQFVVNDPINAINAIAKLARNNFKFPLIGITGSHGKTSTKEILKLLLNISTNVTSGSENGHLGLPLSVAKIQNKEKYAVIEIGIDQANTMESLCNIANPDIAIITGISHSHSANFTSQDQIAQEKFKLATHVLQKNGLVIASQSCMDHEIFKKNANKISVIHSTIIDKTEYRELLCNGSKFTIPNPMSIGTINDLSLAIHCAQHLGISDEIIQKRLKKWAPYKLRGEIIEKGGKIFYADCYNANDASFFDSLENFHRLYGQNNNLFIIGALKESEIGIVSHQTNFKIGQFIHLKPNDIAILIGESAPEIAKGLTESGANISQVKILYTKQQAIEIIENFSGTVYLKGHHSYALETLLSNF